MKALIVAVVMSLVIAGAGACAGIELLVPAVARVVGEEGSLWRSDLVIHNPGTVAADVTLALIERDQSNPDPVSVSLRVEPGASLMAEDLLATLYGRSDVVGALLLSCDQTVVVSSRTFNLETNGDGQAVTWGQHVPAILVADFAAKRLNLVTQLRDDEAFRTNLGLVNLGYDTLKAWVAPIVFDGENPKARMRRVPAYGMSQFDRILAEPGAPVADAMISIDTDFLSGPFLSWASVVDNRTGDAIFVPPVEPRGGVVYIPAAAHAPGANATLWRTDLEVVGDPYLTVVYRLEWLPEEGDNGSPVAVEFTMIPGQATRHRDVVESVFGANGSGAIRVTMLLGEPLITSHTYTEDVRGTYGQFVPGTPAAQAAGPNQKAVLIALRQSGESGTGYRTNLGVLNTSDRPIDVAIGVADADGRHLTTIDFTLRAFGWRQLNQVLRGLTGEDVELASAVVTTSTAGGSLLAWASVIDNASGDPIYVPAQKMMNNVMSTPSVVVETAIR